MLLEQVVLELTQEHVQADGSIKYEEAIIDVVLRGHSTAPDRLFDGTIRHATGFSVDLKDVVTIYEK